MQRFARPVILLFVAAAIALISPAVSEVPSLDRQSPTAQSSNPCASLPRVCRYTYDPKENCCVADPRFDCYDICF